MEHAQHLRSAHCAGVAIGTRPTRFAVSIDTTPSTGLTLTRLTHVDSGYWTSTDFLQQEGPGEVEFYDSVTGKLLFVAPRGRSWEEFVAESRDHG